MGFVRFFVSLCEASASSLEGGDGCDMAPWGLGGVCGGTVQEQKQAQGGEEEQRGVGEEVRIRLASIKGVKKGFDLST